MTRREGSETHTLLRKLVSRDLRSRCQLKQFRLASVFAQHQDDKETYNLKNYLPDVMRPWECHMRNKSKHSKLLRRCMLSCRLCESRHSTSFNETIAVDDIAPEVARGCPPATAVAPGQTG